MILTYISLFSGTILTKAKKINHLTVYKEDAVLLGMDSGDHALPYHTSYTSPSTTLEESSQSLGQLLNTVLHVVDTGPAQSSSFAVEFLVRTCNLEPTGQTCKDEPLCHLVICHVPVLVSSSLW